MCQAAILWARIDAVVYAATAQDAADAGFDDAVIRQNVCAETPSMLRLTRELREGAGDPFDAWRAQPDRDEY